MSCIVAALFCLLPAQEPLEGAHQLPLTRVIYSPDGKHLVTSGEDNFVVVWDAATRKAVAKLTGHEKFIPGLAFLPDGTLLTSELHKVLIFWDLKTARELKRVELPFPVSDLALASDGKRLYVAGREAKVLPWDLAAKPEDTTAWTGDGTQVGVSVAPGGARVVSLGEYGDLVVFDAVKGEALHKLKHGEEGRAIAVSPDGKTFATGGGDASLKLWDLDKGTPKEGFACPGLDVRSLAWSKDGKTILAGVSEGQIKLVEAATGKVRDTLVVGESPVVSLALSPDGKKVAVASLDPVAKVFPMK